MRVDVTPKRLSAVPGERATITISVANTGTIIAGHRVRVLGIDPQWAQLDQDDLSLFPETSGVAVLTVTLPPGIPAGTRTLSIEVTELTPPGNVSVTDVELTVPAEPGVKLALDPPNVNGGRTSAVAVVLENTGNAPLDVVLDGKDEEGEVSFAFTPPKPVLAPGEQVIGSAKLWAKRPWFGSPKVRPFTIEAGPPRAPVIAYGAWVQKPRLTRGAMALFGLLAAATVFAVVLTATLSQVVNRSTADRNLALQVAEAASQTNGNSGTSNMSGTVTLLTSGTPVAGVSVDVFQASNPSQPVVSTATGANGGYHFNGLASGSYKLEFQGAGFSQLWYPDSLTPDNATSVVLANGQTKTGLDVRLGGLPGTVEGQVNGNASGAVLTVEVPPAAPGDVPTIVTTETLDASGKFSLGNIPSPAVYDLVVSKAGYAPATQEVDLSGGETRSNISISLHLGNGSIAGSVSTAAGPLGGATISASDGSTTVNTVSLTTAGGVGNFVLNNLPTPDTLTLVVSAPGYATQTLSLSLTDSQQLSGVSVFLVSGVGSISGTVTTSAGPAGGVKVTATDGKVTVSTVTLSTGAVGTYTLAGLSAPDTYTVTFSRSDLASETQAVDIPATGTTAITGIDVEMVGDTASIFGTVKQTDGTPLGEVTILLSSGNTSYTVTSATVPTAGAYEIDNVTPGTYTISFTRQGGQPTSSILTLTAGQRLPYNPVLNPAASISGKVVALVGDVYQPVPGADVRLYLASQFPTVMVTSTQTDTSGSFTFNDVQAPQSFIVAFAYPSGSAAQETVLINTQLGQPSTVCQQNATGANTTTTTPSNASPPTTAAGGCGPIIVSTS